jgi:hypothetical protein
MKGISSSGSLLNILLCFVSLYLLYYSSYIIHRHIWMTQQSNSYANSSIAPHEAQMMAFLTCKCWCHLCRDMWMLMNCIDLDMWMDELCRFGYVDGWTVLIWICGCCVWMSIWCLWILWMFMYVCILYCPSFEFSAVGLVFSCFCNFFLDSKLIYDGEGWAIVDWTKLSTRASYGIID